MPAFVMISRHFTISAEMKRANSSDVVATASAPSSLNLSRTTVRMANGLAGVPAELNDAWRAWIGQNVSGVSA